MNDKFMNNPCPNYIMPQHPKRMDTTVLNICQTARILSNRANYGVNTHKTLHTGTPAETK